jgi:hypothetical protein
MRKGKRLGALLLKEGLVNPARWTHPIIGEIIKRNALGFFIIHPFANGAYPF